MLKRTCKNLNLDLVNTNAYIKYDENLSICSQDIERKRNFGVTLVQICEKGCVTIPS